MYVGIQLHLELLLYYESVSRGLFYSDFLFPQDSDYGHPLVIPSTGLELRTRIYVEVKAVNLTGK